MKKGKRFVDGGVRFIVIIILIGSTYSYAMFQGGFVSWFIFYTIIPFLIYSLLFSFAPIQIQNVQREIKPAKLQRGDRAFVRVSFTNKTWFPLLFLTVEEMQSSNSDRSPFKLSKQIFFVGFKRKFEWTYEIPEVERGLIDFKGIQLTFYDFFGWTARFKLLEEPKSVIVYPKLTAIKYKPMKVQFEHGGAPSPFTLVKDTSIVTGVRDYQPGDRSSWIHWKSFAKNEVLRSKEFEDRQTQDIFLTINQSAVKNFEDVVDLTGSILQSVIKHHGEISFLTTGNQRQYFPKMNSQAQVEKAMRHLAVMMPNDEHSFVKTLAGEVGRLNFASLIIVTGELTEELKDFFVKSSTMTRGIFCFVVSSSKKSQETYQTFTNVKVIPITPKNFENAFTEVMKP